VVDSLLSQHPDKKGKKGQEKRGEKRAKKKKGKAQKQNRRQERTETQKRGEKLVRVDQSRSAFLQPLPPHISLIRQARQIHWWISDLPLAFYYYLARKCEDSAVSDTNFASSTP
jgi:hypothetical protein